jgi:hypothetical protein
MIREMIINKEYQEARQRGENETLLELGTEYEVV